MAPLHTQAFPNRMLRAADLVAVTGTGAVDPAASRTNAVTVGGAANIYINLQGREPTGIVPLEQYESLQDEIVKVFKAVTDPVTNEPVFEIILKKPRPTELTNQQSHFYGKTKRGERERDFHVFGEDTGDVFIASRPGYNLDFNAGTGNDVGSLLQPSTFFGQHGYDPKLPEMKAIFYAIGPDFFRRATLREVHSIDVAPTIADLLGIEAPRDAQGRKLNNSSR
jgi:predicted AlkP superfamily phosphohydrolase/phosphomutase